MSEQQAQEYNQPRKKGKPGPKPGPKSQAWEDAHKRCGAKTRAGGTCKRWAMDNGRCRIHGGLSPRGIASPHFKTGRHSRYLPTRMVSRYEEAVSDPELLSLRDEIATVDARVADLLTRVDTGEAGQAWTNAASALVEVQTAIASQDVYHMQTGLAKLEAVLSKGKSDYAAWGEIVDLFETRRRLVGDERKRLVEMNQVITAERAMLLVGAILEVIRKNVEDRKILSAISRDISVLVEAGGQ